MAKRLDLAYGLAAGGVQAKRSPATLRRANAQADDGGALLVQPWQALAEQRGLTEAVAALVKTVIGHGMRIWTR